MNYTQLIILVLIGLVAGFSSGLLGIGGAIILIPGLVFLIGINQQMAQGTSLAVLLFPVGIVATFKYYKHGFVNWQIALILIVTFVIGTYFGSSLAVNVPEKILKKIFAILLLLVGVKMFFTK